MLSARSETLLPPIPVILIAMRSQSLSTLVSMEPQNPPWMKALHGGSALSFARGLVLLRVQAIIVAIDQYVEGSSRRPEPRKLLQKWVESITGRDGHEAEPVHGRTDHRDLAGAGAGRRRPTCAASTESAAQRSTNGRPSSAGWKCPMPSDRRHWRTRTPS